jgi:osmotically-inducible protein OsmY
MAGGDLENYIKKHLTRERAHRVLSARGKVTLPGSVDPSYLSNKADYYKIKLEALEEVIADLTAQMAQAVDKMKMAGEKLEDDL